MKKKYNSLGFNAILNALKQALSIIFPLITFPYISRVLLVDNIGKYDFALSTVNYFVLIAGLGINTYAIREGSKIRDDRNQISAFSSEVYTINIVSMIVSYLLLGGMITVIPKFHQYTALIAVLSLEILFKTIGTEWLFSIYEEYAYITLRSIFFQVLSIILMFVFVKKPQDYIIYAGITVFANVGNNLLNVLHRRKLCKCRLITKFNYKQHLKPIFTIFSLSVATTLYVNSDTTILGFLTSDYNVGLYAVSVKIYKIVKTMLSAVLVVSIPRLTSYIGSGEKESYQQTFNYIFNIMIMYILPAAVGILLLSEEIITIIADRSFLDATLSLKILSAALILSLFGWLFTACVLIPHNREKQVLIATVVSAIINIMLNFALIPHYKQDAAAFTTVIAEGCSMLLCIYWSKGLYKLTGVIKNILSVIIGCLSIGVVCEVLRSIELKNVIYVPVAIICSVVVYALILVICRNPFAFDMLNKLQNRIRKYGKAKPD